MKLLFGGRNQTVVEFIGFTYSASMYGLLITYQALCKAQGIKSHDSFSFFK